MLVPRLVLPNPRRIKAAMSVASESTRVCWNKTSGLEEMSEIQSDYG